MRTRALTVRHRWSARTAARLAQSDETAMLRGQFGYRLRNPPGQQYRSGRTQTHDSHCEQRKRHKKHFKLQMIE
jgi:hypothetical protein